MDPKPEGSVAYPGVHGGTNWFSQSYSPETGLMHVAMREEGTTFYGARAEFKTGNIYTAGGIHRLPGVEPAGAIEALDPATAGKKCEFPLHSPPWAGVLSTAGGLVLGGTNEGNFLPWMPLRVSRCGTFRRARRCRDPHKLRIGGKQNIALTAGRALLVFGLE